MLTWNKLRNGRYEALRNGERVFTVERIKDTGEPIWEGRALDGTILSRHTGVYKEYVSLAEAKQAYEYRSRNPISDAR